ncbi:hypothetical protein BX667DRAFT_505815 [Coemansia mojavensis]|nr:hypothetical protein BX667DRAFT_505815 [Coemansia mojavensis]
MVVNQEVKAKYEAILRGEIEPKDWDLGSISWDNRYIYIAALIKYPEFADKLDKVKDSDRWKRIFEFVRLVYHNELPKMSLSYDLRYINLSGLPVPSKEVVDKLLQGKYDKDYDEEWNWKYFAKEWNDMGHYSLYCNYESLDNYSRDWINYSFDWKDDMDLLFVFDMFWDKESSDTWGIPDDAELIAWLEDIGVTDSLTGDLTDDLDKACDYLHKRGRDRNMFFSI